LALRSICPSCGKPSNGICTQCAARKRTIATIPSFLEVKICPTCFDYFFKGKWLSEEINSALTRTVREALTIDADDARVTIALGDVTQTLVVAQVLIEASVQGHTLQDRLAVTIRVLRETCVRCSRISGGYYESKIQIRAENRVPDETELEHALQIAHNTLERAQKLDRMAFIAKTVRLKEGLDLFVGTIKAARQIATALVKQMGGTFSDSARLTGRRDGKNLYRVTFAVRLPRFAVGSIVTVGQRIYVIYSVTSKTNAVDLETGRSLTLKARQLADAHLLGVRRDAEKTVIVSISGDEVQLLDPDTYTTLTIAKPQFIFKEYEGKEVEVIKTTKGVFILP